MTSMTYQLYNVIDDITRNLLSNEYNNLLMISMPFGNKTISLVVLAAYAAYSAPLYRHPHELHPIL